MPKKIETTDMLKVIWDYLNATKVITDDQQVYRLSKVDFEGILFASRLATADATVRNLWKSLLYNLDYNANPSCVNKDFVLLNLDSVRFDLEQAEVLSKGVLTTPKTKTKTHTPTEDDSEVGE